VQVGLLGSLYVTGDNETVQIRAAQQRILVAALATEAGSVVPVDVLAEAIWGNRLPGSWRDTLRNLVRRLRANLGPQACMVVTRSPGYQLDVSPQDVDMLAFVALRKAGLGAARRGDWEQAADTLARGEGLWRGTPFLNVPSALLSDAHVHYLEEQLLDVRETRIEADIRLAPPRAAAAVVPDLQRLVGQHPERESVRYLLMLALFRTGRQAQAQAAFHDAWAYSTSELGVQPGHALRDLNERIISGDQSLLDDAARP
jgi:DNA-binding SARP family transcriptional activator